VIYAQPSLRLGSVFFDQLQVIRRGAVCVIIITKKKFLVLSRSPGLSLDFPMKSFALDVPTFNFIENLETAGSIRGYLVSPSRFLVLESTPSLGLSQGLEMFTFDKLVEDIIENVPHVITSVVYYRKSFFFAHTLSDSYREPDGLPDHNDRQQNKINIRKGAFHDSHFSRPHTFPCW
jgi:hypothetical protein